MDQKITCSICEKEEKKYCTVKKTTVHPNKKRRCNKFIFAPDKVKAREAVRTTRLTWQEQEDMRQQYKKELKRYKKMMKGGKLGQVPTQKQSQPDAAHPMTGDLSRFVSSAGVKDDG